jgi:choline dehydrogenase-like flavoprotein
LAKPSDIKPRERRSVKGVSRRDTDDERPVLRADGILSPPIMDPAPDNQYEYIVVGSGAGGGTLAARLAERGRRVLLLEAGGDAHDLQGGDSLAPNSPRLPDDYDVPAFHTLASENDALSWRFFVQHRPGGLDQLDLPGMEFADDAVEALGAVMQAVSEGKISPSEGAAIATLINSYTQAIEMADVVKRLDSLEAQIKGRPIP